MQGCSRGAVVLRSRRGTVTGRAASRGPSVAGMRYPIPLIAALALLIAAPIHAQSAPPAPDTLSAAPEIEPLYAALKSARSQAEADRIARQIWSLWLTAPDEPAQALLDSAMRRRQALDFLGAIAALDRLVENYPDYTEGWNQRATLHFMRGDYAASLADVAQVLAREPRHFGALSGKAVILFRQGKAPLAQLTLRQALEVHPFLRERALLDAVPGQEL